MSPEEHFRRLRSEEVWTDGNHMETASTARPVRTRVHKADSGPIWATAVVGAVLTVVTLATLHTTASVSPGQPAAAPSVSSSAPTSSASPQPSEPEAASSSTPPDPSMRQLHFYPSDPADTTRANTIIACFKRHGVTIVDLEPAEGVPGAMEIAFGGPKNDQTSITKGLQFSDECFAEGGPAH